MGEIANQCIQMMQQMNRAMMPMGAGMMTVPVLLSVGIILVVFIQFQQQNAHPSTESPLEVLKRRYALGEIDAAEYHLIKNRIMED